MKKALFVVAAVALLAVAAQAGEIKFHNWPCTPTPQEVARIPVFLEVGYWVQIPDQGDLSLTLTQVSIHEYTGCTNFKIRTNTEMALSADINKILGGGDQSWSVTFTPGIVPGGAETVVQVCATVTKLDLMGLPGGTKQKIAELIIKVVPTSV